MSKMPEFIKGCSDRATIVDVKLGDDYRKMLESQEKQFKQIWDEVKDQYTKK